MESRCQSLKPDFGSSDIIGMLRPALSSIEKTLFTKKLLRHRSCVQLLIATNPRSSNQYMSYTVFSIIEGMIALTNIYVQQFVRVLT